MPDSRVPDPQDPFATADMQTEHTAGSKAIFRWLAAAAALIVVLCALAFAVGPTREAGDPVPPVAAPGSNL